MAPNQSESVDSMLAFISTLRFEGAVERTGNCRFLVRWLRREEVSLNAKGLARDPAVVQAAG
jgi:hypothetical protein